MLFFILGTLLALIAVWGIIGIFMVYRVETLQYTILKKHDGYELRQYAPYVTAETAVTADNERTALREGFRIVAAYIFGANHSVKAATVTSTEASGTKIAMTAPVLSSEDRDSTRTVAFVMPARYESVTDLPTPTDERVRVRPVPARTVAVRHFSGYATNRRIDQEKQYLREDLEEDGVKTVGPLTYAGYNPPLTAPFVQRHEIWVEVATEDTSATE